MNYKELLKNITTFIFDVDGVLTRGEVILLPTGEPVRVMNIKDGYALQLAKKKGYHIGIISGGRSEAVRLRFKNLGIKDVYLGAGNKMEFFQKYISKYNIPFDNILYMGDDLPDYPPMQKVLLPCCPADAAEEIKSICKYISPLKGGKGCVRDVIEQTMKAQNKWEIGDW